MILPDSNDNGAFINRPILLPQNCCRAPSWPEMVTFDEMNLVPPKRSITLEIFSRLSLKGETV